MKHLNIISLIAVYAILSISASPLLANLVIDVQAISGTGYTISSDGKSVTMTGSSANINFKVYAMVSGTNSNTSDDELQTVYGGFVITQGTQATGYLTNTLIQAHLPQ